VISEANTQSQKQDKVLAQRERLSCGVEIVGDGGLKMLLRASAIPFGEKAPSSVKRNLSRQDHAVCFTANLSIPQLAILPAVVGGNLSTQFPNRKSTISFRNFLTSLPCELDECSKIILIGFAKSFQIRRPCGALCRQIDAPPRKGGPTKSVAYENICNKAGMSSIPV
jgi:hypothetical protein